MNDTIKRENVLNALLRMDGTKIDKALAIGEIRSIPSVNRPQGEWIQLPSVYRPKEFACGFMCSLCKSPTYDKFRYCPNCGTKMKGENNDI